MARKPPIKVGDRFVKIGTYQTAVWVVSKIYQLPAAPPHVNLEKEGRAKESLTISLPTLDDPHYFKRS